MAMLYLDIVTPEKRAFSGEVEMVLVPGSEGELGILPAHSPLVTSLRPGELRYTQGKEETSLAIGTGIVEISHDKVSVLTDMVDAEADIDESAVEKALERAQKALSEKQEDDPEVVAAHEIAILKAQAQLQVKRRRKHR